MEVTTASKFSEKLSGAAGVMSVVTQDELRRFGAQTLAEALERVPGLTPTSAYFTDRRMVAVRGDGTKEIGSHVLMLINGRPVREPHDGGILSDLLQSLPVNAIERIEVIRGPGSVMYGTNAFSGVINVITKKARGQSITMRGAGVEEGGLGSGSGEFMIERGKFNLLAALQTRRDPPRRTGYNVPEFDALLGPRPRATTGRTRSGPGRDSDRRLSRFAPDDRIHRLAVEFVRAWRGGRAALAARICQCRLCLEGGRALGHVGGCDQYARGV